MTAAFTGGLTFKTDSVLAATFVTLPEVNSVSGIGKTNETIDVTNFDSSGSKEYIAGLADGTEISVDCNLIAGDVQQLSVIGEVDSGTNFDIEFTITDGTTPKVYSFTVAPVSWTINPAVGDKHTLSFTLKISGAITVA